jgi:hypothetical protein
MQKSIAFVSFNENKVALLLRGKTLIIGQSSW